MFVPNLGGIDYYLGLLGISFYRLVKPSDDGVNRGDDCFGLGMDAVCYYRSFSRFR